MRKLLRIDNFAKNGINSDIIPWNLSSGYLTEISNIRITANYLEPCGGHAEWADLPAGEQPGYIMPVGSTSGSFWLILCKESVYAYDGSSFSDISNADGYTGISEEDLWSGCLLSNIPVINNPGHYPEYWPQQSTGVSMEYLPWDQNNTWEDAGETCQIMRSHKQFLFAMNLQSGLNEWEDGVRWSAPADIGGVPSSWDPLDTTNVAGLTNLGGDGGKIIDGRSLRDAFVVYRESGISVFDYIGGRFVWRIRHLSTEIGLSAANSLVEAEGSHYFIGNGDIYINDGNSIKSLLHNRLLKRFKASINPDSYTKSYAIKNMTQSEIWFCIPTSGSTYPNKAFVYNWRDNNWSIRDIPESPFGSYGSQNTAVVNWETIDTDWSQAKDAWSSKQISPLFEAVIAVTKPADVWDSGKLLLLQQINTEDNSSFDANIERIGFPLEGVNSVSTITRIYPHVQGSGLIFVQLGSQDYPGAPTRWKPAVKFNVGVDRKVDVRTTGELHCFRLFSNSSEGNWQVSGMDVEYVLAGER